MRPITEDCPTLTALLGCMPTKKYMPLGSVNQGIASAGRVKLVTVLSGARKVTFVLLSKVMLHVPRTRVLLMPGIGGLVRFHTWLAPQVEWSITLVFHITRPKALPLALFWM